MSGPWPRATKLYYVQFNQCIKRYTKSVAHADRRTERKRDRDGEIDRQRHVEVIGHGIEIGYWKWSLFITWRLLQQAYHKIMQSTYHAHTHTYTYTCHYYTIVKRQQQQLAIA